MWSLFQAAWISITDGQSWDDKPRWSTDGRTIYYVSFSTGFPNTWGIRFDPERGRALGQPFRVTSLENPELTISDNTNLMSMSLSRNQLVFSMSERSGSIWMLDGVDR